MKKHWLYYIRPCLSAAAICAFEIVRSIADLEHSEGWSFLTIIFLGPTLVLLLVADFIVRMVTDNLLYIWIIEGIILAIIIIGLVALCS